MFLYLIIWFLSNEISKKELIRNFLPVYAVEDRTPRIQPLMNVPALVSDDAECGGESGQL